MEQNVASSYLAGVLNGGALFACWMRECLASYDTKVEPIALAEHAGYCYHLLAVF